MHAENTPLSPAQNSTIQLDPHRLEELVGNVVEQVTRKMARVDLCQAKDAPDQNSDTYSVWTTIESPYHLRLLVCAEQSFLRRCMENMLGESSSDPADLEDCTMEFFNVLCGRLVGEIFQESHAGAWFPIPNFAHSFYTDAIGAGQSGSLVCFISDRREHMAVFFSTEKSA